MTQPKSHFISDLIYKALSNKTTAGKKVFPHFVLEEKLPNIVFKRSEWKPIDFKLGYAVASTVIFNVCAEDYDQCCHIMDELIEALQSTSDPQLIEVIFEGGSEDANEEEKWFVAECTFTIKHY